MTRPGRAVVIGARRRARIRTMKTKVIKTGTREGYREAVNAAAEVLENGGIVGMPTETVYGLAASAEHVGAIERLKKIKKRPGEKKFTICLPLKSDVKRFAGAVPRAAEKLINRFWPGPLTLVLPGKADGTVGLRVPELSFVRDVLLKADTTIVIPSANPHGIEPARSAEEVVKHFDGSIELVVDAGASRLGVASTVVEVSAEGQIRVLRQGAISEDELRRAVVRTILFICTGNLCRSPMAEGIAKTVLSRRLGVSEEGLERAGFRLASAGTGTFGASPPSAEAVEVMREKGIDISGHVSRSLTLEALQEADEIFAMSAHHLDTIRGVDSQAAARSALISPEGDEIVDPIGQPIEVYRRVRRRLFDAIVKRLGEP